MADGLVQVPPDSTGKKVDTTELTVNAQTVERQRINLADPVSATGLAPVTSSYGLSVSIASTNTLPVAMTSGVVTLSSVPTVTATAGTNPWSSAPGFNLPMVSASSGLVQISGAIGISSGTVSLSSNPTVISASSGVVQVLQSTSPWAVVSASSGLIQLTSAISLSSGTVTLSSNPTVVNASSGIVQVLQSTTPWAILSASSGVVQTLSSGAIVLSSVGVTQVLTSGATVLSSGGVTQVLQSTGTAGGVTSTFFQLSTVKGVKAGAGRLFGFSVYTTIASGTPVLVFYDFTSSLVSVGTSMELVVPIQTMTTGTTPTAAYAMPTWFGPNGIAFANGISLAPQASATGAVLSTTTFTVAPSVSVFYV